MTFDQIWLDHRAYVERVCYSILRNREDMQDAVQETFLRVYKALDGFAGESSIGTWVGTIARNAAISHLQKQRKCGFTLNGSERLVRIEVVSLYEPVGAGRGSSAQLALCDLIRDESALSPETQVFFREVMQMVDELPDHLKQPFLLMLQGYTYNQICTMVGMISALNMIKARIFRARKAIAGKVGR